MITQKRLKEVFDYNGETGMFTWKITKSSKSIKGNLAGSVSDKGYLTVRIDGGFYRLHRLAWLYITGSHPEGQIDHIDRNKTNNKFNNLRITSNTENCRNKTMNKSNTTGVTGIYWRKSTKKWQVSIKVNYKSVHIGCFNNLKDAITARKDANKKYKFSDNHGTKVNSGTDMVRMDEHRPLTTRYSAHSSIGAKQNL